MSLILSLLGERYDELPQCFDYLFISLCINRGRIHWLCKAGVSSFHLLLQWVTLSKSISSEWLESRLLQQVVNTSITHFKVGGQLTLVVEVGAFFVHVALVFGVSCSHWVWRLCESQWPVLVGWEIHFSSHLQMEKKEFGRGENSQNLRGDAYSSMLRRVQVLSSAYSSHVLPESEYSQLLSIQTCIWNKPGEHWN